MAPPVGKGRDRFSRRGRGGRGRSRGSGHQRSDFRASRIEDTRCVLRSTSYHISVADTYRDTAASNATNGDNSSGKDYPINNGSVNGSESEEDTSTPTGSYSQLLQSLISRPTGSTLATKKRKLLDGTSKTVANTPEGRNSKDQTRPDSSSADDLDLEEDNQLDSDHENIETDGHAVEDDQDQDGLVEDQTDPFEYHFANPDSKIVSKRLKAIKDVKWTSVSKTTSDGLRQQYSLPDSQEGATPGPSSTRTLEGLKFKRRIGETGQKLWGQLGVTQREIASPIFNYKDVLFGSRTIDNAASLRELTVLHALNHVFKTRDRVIKNNARLEENNNGDASEIRDQGFTRPKVLFILPTRQACVRFVDSITKLSQPEQQENKSRFMESFAQGDDDAWQDKPRDFQDLFGGNDDDMFRIGLKFTRKTIKFFSAFYNSDMILASPLGLRTVIETGGSKDGKKSHDADFLSSIEVVIVDHANALLMQNWQHVDSVLSQLNLLPKESHGCDFSRVRHWYLDGEAKFFRQTIVLTDFITPEINSAYTKTMLNFAGKIKYTPVYKGAMLDVAASLPINITQTFLRLNAPTAASDADVRFSHFTSSILPSLLKSKQEKGTLIFTSSYLDFVRLRNHFSTSSTTASLSFGAISEYTSVRDVVRARTHFLTGRHSVLLYSERAHHFRRYKLKGVQRVVFYSLPENPTFWGEVVGLLNPEFADMADSGQRMVRALFSRWDVLKLERIVGTSRVGKMVNDKAGDTFEFT